MAAIALRGDSTGTKKASVATAFADASIQVFWKWS